MATNETNETKLAATYPWQRTALILVTAIATLFSGIIAVYQSSLNDGKAREQVLQSELGLAKKTIGVIAKEKDSCNEGKVALMKEVLNREIAIKLSKDTSQTVRKIVESLMRNSEQGGKK